MSQIDHLFIVGAGFSHYAGLPLTNHFTEELLNVGELKKGQSQRIVKFLRGFVYETFDHSRRAKARFWPQLEDLFTCIDLSANTGHYLGPKYSPKVLRTVRRALIVRTIRMGRHRAGQSAHRRRARIDRRGQQGDLRCQRRHRARSRCRERNRPVDRAAERGFA